MRFWSEPRPFRDFAEGRITLPVEILQRMTERFFNSAEFDATADRLVSTGPASIGLPNYSTPFVAGAVSYPPVRDPTLRAAISGLPPAEPYRKPAGWRLGWL